MKKNNCNYKAILHTASDGDSFAYKELRFDTWTSLRRYLSEWSENHPEGRYMFRGHADSSWTLEPTIDRLGVNSSQVELESLSKFQRGIPVFATAKDISFLNTPQKHLEWLAIMQHHGAATRLLDFSESPFIAAFFAMANLNTENKEKCIWALPLEVLDSKNKNDLQNELKKNTLQDIYSDLNLKSTRTAWKNILGYSNPVMQFERIFRQQGTFIYSLSDKRNFFSLLRDYFDDKTFDTTPMIKLVVKRMSRDKISQAIKDLKTMNITYSSLFPDIDGYSKDILMMQYTDIS